MLSFCFITTSVLSKHATLKRACGMAPVLCSTGHVVTVVIQDHPDSRLYALQHPEVEWVFFPQLSVLKERSWKRRFLDKRVFDVVIYNALGWRNSVRGKNTPVLSLMEHCELESANRNISIFRRLAMYVLEWWCIWAFNGQIGASRYLVDLLNRRCFCLGWRRLIVWAPYGVDASIAISPSKVNGTSNTGPDKKLILHVGTVADEYGASFMIEGLASLKMIRDDWRAVFVGHGPALDACREKIKAMDLEKFVDMPGFVPEADLRVLLSQASVFLSHLNNTEQDWARCPSKVYYYMAKGRPVVTTTVGENRVALGESGFYYDADSPASFSVATSRALDAGPNWCPAYSPENVTWEYRTAELLRVINPLFEA